jgi:hypothetical protein
MSSKKVLKDLKQERGHFDLFLICAPLLGGILEPFSSFDLATTKKFIG